MVGAPGGITPAHTGLPLHLKAPPLADSPVINEFKDQVSRVVSAVCARQIARLLIEAP